MEKRLIAAGLVAGALAGLTSFAYARLFVTPVIDRAVAYEEGRTKAAELPGHGVELFTRGVQANIGMGFGVLAFSVAMGALFAVVFCVAYGRLGNFSARLLAVLLAAGMFLSLYLVPALKYPKNPPAVGQEGTLQQRSMLFVLMVVLSAVLVISAVWVARRLSPRLGHWNATLAAAGSYVLATALVMRVLPTFDETPNALRDHTGAIVYPGFAADDLYEFRLHSLGTALVMWVTTALVFAALAARLVRDGSPAKSSGLTTL
ncbi:cobalt transporter [Mycolicibacterium arabiense]|uniref:Cobalt transporter n=1 Tax=Mycolicibacterium arabiense TaxID=1286181 RepID=A0A7I7S7N5_9MYCO|nr:CbtA family protein [Mycolicibacterium arabiense]MCV7376394.1 CbtA family protein [Mycolicibacterium arabiense]BBY52703.1 cobalt transporter [Mycolicibacterium arabiense]